MQLLRGWWKSNPSPKRQRTAPRIESLETRNLLSADPLPVLLVIADQRDFYYREYSDTRLGIEQNGVEVVVAASTTRPSTPHAGTGEPAGTLGTVIPDIALADADAADYSAIVFVGGWGSSMYQYAFSGSTNYYLDSHYNGDSATRQAANELINDFVAQDKYVAGICHGVTVLAWARVDGTSPLDGRDVSVPWVGTPAMIYNGTYHPYFYAAGQYDMVTANGATANTVSGQYGNPTTTADDVVVDGRIITAENYDSALYFGQVIATNVLADVEPPPPPPPVGMVGEHLFIQGTPGNDTIYVWSGSSDRQVSAWMNGTSYGPFALPANGRVIVHAGEGNDRVYATDLRVGAKILGEGGHDTMVGSQRDDLLDGGDGWDYVCGNLGNDVVLGGAGNDTLNGYAGRDILIGGLGSDQIQGGDGEDILVGGSTSYDNDRAAQNALMSVWSKPLDFASRVASLSDAASAVKLRAGETVHDDGVGDSLCSGAGADLVFAGLSDGWCPGDREDVMR